VANAWDYGSTSIDWPALNALARSAAVDTPVPAAAGLGYIDRAANTFVDVCGPHWLLDHRMEDAESTAAHAIEEDHTENFYVLLPDGQLTHVSIVESGRFSNPIGAWRRYEDHHTVWPMNETDVLAFDFAKG